MILDGLGFEGDDGAIGIDGMSQVDAPNFARCVDSCF